MVIIRVQWTRDDGAARAGFYARGPSAGLGVWIVPAITQATLLTEEDADAIAAFMASGGRYDAIEIIPQ